MPDLRLFQLPHAKDLPLPAYAREGDAGLDLIAAVPAEAPLVVRPGERALVPTGLIVAVPEGHEMQVRPRSGLALKHGITVLNSPGTVDSGFRNEVMVLVINHGREPFVITRGMRVAQAVIAAYAKVTVRAVADPQELGETARGKGGFGSTGTQS